MARIQTKRRMYKNLNHERIHHKPINSFFKAPEVEQSIRAEPPGQIDSSISKTNF
jgi:hypothetical protein